MSLMIKANMDGVFLGIETPSYGLPEGVRKDPEPGRGPQGGGEDHPAARNSRLQRVHHRVRLGPGVHLRRPGAVHRAGGHPHGHGRPAFGRAGTRLFDRLRREGRLLGLPSGNNTADSGALNFITKMNREKLIEGYRSVLQRLYGAQGLLQPGPVLPEELPDHRNPPQAAPVPGELPPGPGRGPDILAAGGLGAGAAGLLDVPPAGRVPPPHQPGLGPELCGRGLSLQEMHGRLRGLQPSPLGVLNRPLSSGPRAGPGPLASLPRSEPFRPPGGTALPCPAPANPPGRPDPAPKALCIG